MVEQTLLRPGGSVEPLELVTAALAAGGGGGECHTGGARALQQLRGGWAPCSDQLLAETEAASRQGLQSLR